MHRLFEYFLKIVTSPRYFTLRGTLQALLVICGFGVLYLLTLRKNEEGKIEDYLRRIWKRIYQIRERALSYHLAFINGTASAINSILDRLFGPRLVSLQSTGVMISLALVFTNLYYLIAGIDDSAFVLERALNCLIALAFVAAPLFINKWFSPTCKQGGTDAAYHPVQCRYLIPSSAHSNTVELGVINLFREWGFACLCSSTWIVVWFLGLIVYIYREYVGAAFCVFCFPAEFRPLLLLILLVLFIIFFVAASLFVLFSLTTRLALKKLATTTSTANAIGLLLLGCIPIPVFIVFLELVLIAIRRWVTGDQNIREWIAVGLLLVFSVVFFINALFLVIPIFFFSMAILLFVHRLLWPILERPIDKLHRVGITSHPWVIFFVGAGLITFGIGGWDALLKLLKFWFS